MVNKVLLRDGDNVMLPITRGELVLDSSGNPAFRSEEFLASDLKPGLMPASNSFNPTYISLSKEWKPSGLLLNNTNGFTSGVYIIKIMSGNLIFSGTASVYVGKITTDDEIMLHMSGIPQTYSDGTQGRIYAKIAPSQTADYGEIYLATNVPQSAITNLSITMKKIL